MNRFQDWQAQDPKLCEYKMMKILTNSIEIKFNLYIIFFQIFIEDVLHDSNRLTFRTGQDIA